MICQYHGTVTITGSERHVIIQIATIRSKIMFVVPLKYGSNFDSELSDTEYLQNKNLLLLMGNTITLIFIETIHELFV